MSSVTNRIKKVKQPRGGYIPLRSFDVTQFGIVPPHDSSEENVHPSIVGTAVDYLTRMFTGAEPAEAFKISAMGAANVHQFDEAMALIAQLKALDDDETIDAACKLCGYDVAYRSGSVFFKGVEDIQPDEKTRDNIRAMVESALRFFEEYGPVCLDGPTFPGAYTEIVTCGDADFTTKSGLWDFKVSKNPPTTKHTLQIAMYYVMGIHSVLNAQFEFLNTLGFYNPRRAEVYTICVDDIPSEVLRAIETDVIGYEVPFF